MLNVKVEDSISSVELVVTDESNFSSVDKKVIRIGGIVEILVLNNLPFFATFFEMVKGKDIVNHVIWEGFTNAEVGGFLVDIILENVVLVMQELLLGIEDYMLVEMVIEVVSFEDGQVDSQSVCD